MADNQSFERTGLSSSSPFQQLDRRPQPNLFALITASIIGYHSDTIFRMIRAERRASSDLVGSLLSRRSRIPAFRSTRPMIRSASLRAVLGGHRQIQNRNAPQSHQRLTFTDSIRGKEPVQFVDCTDTLAGKA
jgi:hypothetical protein